ncbi:DUF397 domain-containing protein [Streptomyces spongiae]|uniref:DUF397 domain-containing protein n=1 Tax=Streptomyces spongiae TaxID=565072 RepID=A0A5N8XBI8_9ACTN|nr:DUF397 domain-containing protein [Streptomyces spongiae]MPY56802.1 DUF397 domain-containing protein [Streptomyces spongiae]
MNHALHWQRSSFSGGGEGNTCVELAAAPGIIHLRESDTPHTEVTTAPAPLACLLLGIKLGRLAAPSA